jgi:hypothetical protein
LKYCRKKGNDSRIIITEAEEGASKHGRAGMGLGQGKHIGGTTRPVKNTAGRSRTRLRRGWLLASDQVVGKVTVVYRSAAVERAVKLAGRDRRDCR